MTTTSSQWLRDVDAALDAIGWLPGVTRVREQAVGLRERLDAGDGWNRADDAERFLRGARVLAIAVERFEIVAITERLSWDRAAKLVLSVRTSFSTDEDVLKVDGTLDRTPPFEAPILMLWHDHGIPTAQVRDTVVPTIDGVPGQALLLEKLGARLSGFAHSEPLSPEQALEATTEAAVLARAAHRVPVPGGVSLIDIGSDVDAQLRSALALLDEGPLAPVLDQVDRDALLRRISTPRARKLLIGDLCGENLVRRSPGAAIAGNLALIDPTGTVGEPEADVARAIARFNTSSLLGARGQDRQLERATRAYPELAGDALAPWILSETIIELGWNTDRYGLPAAEALLEHSIERCADRAPEITDGHRPGIGPGRSLEPPGLDGPGRGETGP